jgi:predicted nucleic acid-binding protein
VTTYILDASVAAKWFLPNAEEPLASDAQQVLRDYSNGLVHLRVPDLFWPELGNIFWKSARQGRISQASAEEAITSVIGLRIATSSCQPVLLEAFAIASAFARSVYDGVYVALAVVSNTPFLTADERLANALAARFPIRWLGAV